MADFKFIHLSDLHFHGGSSQRHKTHSHSIPHLKGIQKVVQKEKENMDRLIISGDISHYGDDDNLLRAKQWIFSSMEIGNEERISLGLDENEHDKVRLVPGNHDAWNSKSRNGKIIDIRQKSLENFNYVFRRNGKDVIPFPDGYYFDWLQKGERGVFIVFLDSSYMGDTQIENENPELTIIDRVAKGKISKKQAESVLMLYDKGLLGKLEDPYNSGKYIDKSVFSKALKIVVMHHYIFEPSGQKREPLLQLREKESVFKNFALADTDILMCGHKHYAEIKDHLYLHHFDRRAKARYIFNYFRRLIGIHSLPFQYSDKKGKKENKLISTLISLFLINKYKSHNDNKDIISDDSFIEPLSEILVRGIDNPEGFEAELKSFINECNASALDDGILDEAELSEITKRVRTSLSAEEREKLKELTKHLKRVIKELFSRQFLQLMVGSACKAHDDEKKIQVL
ncbi:MAG: metallophosphoesterase [Saprospiraceae bacterium]|nr:metallophosphoesterase [Saprospiraceae bacterium]